MEVRRSGGTLCLGLSPRWTELGACGAYGEEGEDPVMGGPSVLSPASFLALILLSPG